MKDKLLVLSIYPAPYRFELINELEKTFEIDTFFEHSNGDERNAAWFAKGVYYLLDTPEGVEKFRAAKKKIRDYRLVILYDYSTLESVKLIARCRMARVPYILNADGVMLTSHGSAIREQIKKVLVSGAVGCFASGDHAKSYFLRYGAKEDRVFLHTFSTLHGDDILPVPIGYEQKLSIRRKLGIPDRYDKICIAVGRFIELKRFDALIQIWDQMPKNWCLLLIGGGQEESKYRELIERKQLENVLIEGFHPKQELKEYYCASDLLAHPTSYDVWGLVINEAMACGLPIVVSDHCIAGLELVEQGINGYVVKLYDDQSLKEYVQQILGNDERQGKMSLAALSRIRSYTVENMAVCQRKAIGEILNGKDNNNQRR